MEHQDLNPIIVLKVRNICCAAYQKKLGKELSKLDGVFSVDINPEKSLVSVRGKVDANSLLNIVARTGKHAEIVCFNKKSSHSKCGNNNKSSSQNQHKHPCCHKVDEEEQHKCEDYAPPLVDERICRDYYCRTHRRRTIIRDNLPASKYSSFFGHFPHHVSGPFRHDPRWFLEEPPPPPPTGYGFRWGRHLPGFDDYGSFGYENARGYIIM